MNGEKWARLAWKEFLGRPLAHLLQIGLWYEYFLRGDDGTIGHLDDIDTLGELRGRDLASAHVIDADDAGTIGRGKRRSQHLHPRLQRLGGEVVDGGEVEHGAWLVL